MDFAVDFSQVAAQNQVETNHHKQSAGKVEVKQAKGQGSQTSNLIEKQAAVATGYRNWTRTSKVY